MITGIRGLCNGLGPALYGFVFFLFNVELSGITTIQPDYAIPVTIPTEVHAPFNLSVLQEEFSALVSVNQFRTLIHHSKALKAF